MRPHSVIHSLGIIIATAGRKEIAGKTIDSLALRKSVPAIVIIVGADQSDLPEIPIELPFPVQVSIAPVKGSATQRNHGIRQLPASVEFVSFLDDDMEVHDDYCAEIENVFRSAPEVAGFSGYIMANGNIDRARARQMLDGFQVPLGMPAFGFYPRRWPGFYGCAMNIRRRWLDIEKFDERLPLYAIGEDCELGFRLSRYGSVGGSARCPVAHLAVSSGRISEVGLGYAQIINFLYFANKGVGFPKLTTYFQKLIRLPLVNLFFCLFPFLDGKNSIDRKGRFHGNLLALRDVLRGQIDPLNLVQIKQNLDKQKALRNIDNKKEKVDTVTK
jgi:GT2 family glycosyltransferase